MTTSHDRSGRIDHDAPRHVWRQVADDIAGEIASGVLKPGARLPAEPALAKLYGVARITVRKSIKALVDDNKLLIVRGRGTFVMPERNPGGAGTNGKRRRRPRGGDA
jgi:GntR family transcriptional regulator